MLEVQQDCFSFDKLRFFAMLWASKVKIWQNATPCPSFLVEKTTLLDFATNWSVKTSIMSQQEPILWFKFHWKL